MLCPDPAEAAKCRQLIRTGHPGFDLVPIVIDSGGTARPRRHGGPYLTVFAASMGGIDMEYRARCPPMVLDAMASTEVSDADRLRVSRDYHETSVRCREADPGGHHADQRV